MWGQSRNQLTVKITGTHFYNCERKNKIIVRKIKTIVRENWDNYEKKCECVGMCDLACLPSRTPLRETQQSRSLLMAAPKI